MPPRLITFLGYGEFHASGKATREAFLSELAKYPLAAVLRLCSLLGAVLAFSGDDTEKTVQAGLVKSAFPPELDQRMIQTDRPAFHRLQLLFTAKEALCVCDPALKFVAGQHWGGLGTALLMASDQLYHQFPDWTEDLDKLLGIVATFIPIMEANDGSGFLLKMGRSYRMYSTILPLFKDAGNYFDVPKLFEEATGVPLAIYQALLWGTISRAHKIDARTVAEKPGDCLIPRSWFASTHLEKAVIESFFADISATAGDLAERAAKKRPEGNDFTLLRDRPLLDEADGFFPLDFRFLAEKFESGPFWRVHQHLPVERRADFHSFWGDVFEMYMNWVFDQTCVAKRNRFVRDPRYESNPTEQVCDGIIICDRTAVLLEYKGSTFTAASKYGNDIDALRSEIEQKLVLGKGVGQLRAAVERLGRFDNPDSIKGVDFRDISTLCPVLVLRDDLGSVVGLNAYLNERFQQLKPRRLWRGVMPLFCLSAEDVEKLSPFFGDFSLAAILAARKKADARLLNSFWMTDNKILGRLDQRPPAILKQATRDLTQMTAQTLKLKLPDSL